MGAFGLMADAVGACHLTDLAKLLGELAVKLNIAPQVEVIEEVLKIIIEGVQIEKEVANACEDYADSNWPGFGYNLAKLIKTLLLTSHYEVCVNIRTLDGCVPRDRRLGFSSSSLDVPFDVS